MRPLLSKLNNFWSDRRGNFAILFGIAIVPIFAAMGLAIDYSMANGARTAVQAALDNTALSLSKQMPLDQATLDSKGWTIFSSNLGPTPLVFTQSDLVITTPTTSSLQLQLSSNYELKVAGVLSKFFGTAPTMPVGAMSMVSWGNSRLRVALVLDNTGSMDQAGKMDALKTATKGLLTTLKNAVINQGDIYVSIIPFSKDVNVGPSNFNATWVDWTDWDTKNGTCSLSGYTDKSSCEAPHTVGVCSKPQWTTKNSCQNHNGTWTTTTVNGTWSTANHNTWNGCVTDRSKSTSDSSAPGTAAGYDQKVDVPSGSVPGFPAEQFNSCTIEMMGLNYNWNTMNTLVDSMVSVGNTNQPIGLVWGWQSLVGGGPLTAPALEANYVYNQVIILMSDGLNTQDRWYGDATSIDRRMYYNNGGTVSGTCKNIKATGVQIYTVQVNTGGDPTSTLLQNCATDPSMFFELKTAGALVSTFNQIGTNLANLHIAK